MDFVLPDSLPNRKHHLESLFNPQFLIFHSDNTGTVLSLGTECFPALLLYHRSTGHGCPSHMLAFSLYNSTQMLIGRASVMSDILEKGGLSCRKPCVGHTDHLGQNTDLLIHALVLLFCHVVLLPSSLL